MTTKTPKAPEGYNANDYPPFAVTADLNIFTVRNGALHILMVRRGGEPYKGHWALPGGFCNIAESIEQAAVRELHEETGIKGDKGFHIEQVRTYSNPDRDPRMRVVSVSFAALAANLPDPVAGDDAAEARWWLLEDVLSDEFELAFDHREIITDAVERVRSKLEYTTLATSFLKEPFSLAELRAIYESIWGVTLNPSNFARKIIQIDGFVEPVEKSERKTSGPAPMLYRTGKATTFHPAMKRG